MRDSVVLYLNGRRQEVRGDRLFQSLSDFLRQDRELVGTKVVCAEGDCGSCCVLLGRLESGKIQYRNVTSCIQYVYQLDGTHVVTVEGLKHEGKLSCVQESMVACQGSQCGYCTPGFVVSLHGMLETLPKLSESDLRLGLSGNLCRCTGYEGIIKSGVETDVAQHHRVDQLFPPEPMVNDLRLLSAEPVLIREAQRVFFKPVTVTLATEFRSQHPTCTIIAGGTDLGVVMNKGKLSPTVVMSLAGLAELQRSIADQASITFGALVTLAEMEKICQAALPEMARLLRRHGSPPIRNAGTLAGNIANGSPIGDTMPGLFVLNAEVELTGVGGKRSININEFYTGYRKTVMKPDELITALRIPLPASDEHYRLIKISKRYDLDISTFSAAFWMRGRERVEAIRIAYGGVGPVILRLHKTEKFLAGQTITDDSIDEAAESVRSEISPISDVRGGQDYRLVLAENVLRKFFAEIRGDVPTDNGERSNPPFSSVILHPSSFASNGDAF